ncbi:MAG: isocitrate lyase/PEP mutase family protein [Alphaproteobacteria bacterium]
MTDDLRARLARPPILLAPGVCDGMTATLAEQAGAEALYLSGAAIAYSRFGRPDIGLISMSEVADTLAIVRDRTALPIIVDADTGFGNALNLHRTVRVFERMGANALQIEDQTSPKRCGHLDGKSVIGTAEMTGKLKAALDARQSDRTLIIARTDALAVEGLEPALERAAAYAEAGADMLFIDALRSANEMRTALTRLSPLAPLMANMVEGGKTPMFNATELETMGFAMVIFPGGVVRAQAATARDYYASLLAHGSNAQFGDRMLDFDGVNRIIGTSEMLAQGRSFDGGDK